MKRIRLTERELTNIVKKVISEIETETEDLPSGLPSKYTKIMTSPTKVQAIKFDTPMDYDGVERIMKKFGSQYRFPSNWEKIKNTFNTGHFWSGDEHGTYNKGYYSMKDKEKYNGHRGDKKYLLLIKK